MLFVALNGSPQKEGNTAALLEQGLFVAREKGYDTKWIHVVDALEGAKVPFCNQCTSSCIGQCAEGNTLGDAFELLREADGVLIGTPVYFGTASGQLKGFWDKTRGLRRSKALLNTVGGVVTSGAARFGGQEMALQAVVNMMLVQGMTVVGDGQMGFDCGHFGACAQKPASKDTGALERARITMLRVIEVAEATRHLRRQAEA